MGTLLLVVDAANVVGSRPDGWWRDRAGATRRLAARLAKLAESGMPAGSLPPGLPGDAAEWVVVVEGAARDVTGESAALRIVPAPGSGDDEIVRQAAGAETPVVIVTADRGLRARVEREGATCLGPGWLLRLLDGLEDAALPPTTGG